MWKQRKNRYTKTDRLVFMWLLASQVLMPIIVAFLLFVFVVVYFYFDDKKQKKPLLCPQCGRVIKAEWRSCEFCSLKLSFESRAGSIGVVLGVFSLLFAYIPIIGLVALAVNVYALFKRDGNGRWGLILAILGLIVYFSWRQIPNPSSF